MITVLLVVHILIAVALVGVVLVQKSEGGALGIGGGGGGGFMSIRGTANLLTRTTGILAAAFFATSIILALMAGTHRKPTSVVDPGPATQQQVPAAPAAPSVPKSQ